MGGDFFRAWLALVSLLVISERTVKKHVSNTLSQFHMLDRTQATVLAWQQGLVTRHDASRGVHLGQDKPTE